VSTVKFSLASMGTVVSVQCHNLTTLASADLLLPARIEGVFFEFDRAFSLYHETSELSRIASGAVKLADASRKVREVYAEALEWRGATSGAFTPHRADNVIDLNGIVKALAIEQSGSLLDNAGVKDWSINTGGDVLYSESATNSTIGIVDPADREQLLCAVTLTTDRRAAATSGSAERGEHIWISAPVEDKKFVQVTVLANTITTADVLATAIVAGGADALADITGHWDVDVLTVDSEQHLHATPGFRAALAA